jgi:hypothetical protein
MNLLLGKFKCEVQAVEEPALPKAEEKTLCRRLGTPRADTK